MTTPSYTLAQSLPTITVRVYAGQEVTITIPVLGASGSQVDVAGLDEVRAQIRRSPTHPDILHSWSIAEGNASLGGTPGNDDATATITASPEETALWQAQWPVLDTVWDIEVVDTVGTPRRLCAASPWTVLPEVTQV